MLIAPDHREAKITVEQLEAIADELVPPNVRGKHVISGFMSGVSVYGTWATYDRVKIWYVNENTVVPESEVNRWVSIRWLNQLCGKDNQKQTIR